jgi:penicillin-binding protein 1A
MSRSTLVALAVAVAVVASGCSWRGDVATPIAHAAAAQSSKILDREGRVITTLHAEENRETVPLGRISKALQDAVVAVEDRRFWDHEGVDVRALLRAAITDAKTGRVAEGGSTITQQYVKNALLEPDRTLRRKVQEASLAYRLEQHWTKAKILEGYLNTIYFGNGAYGAEAAAQVYFGVHAADLDLAQSALLAGLIRSPNRYDPFRSRSAALARRATVLAAMGDVGAATATDVGSATNAPLGVGDAPHVARYPAAHFVEEVKRFVLGNDAFGATRDERERSLFTGGLRIQTTLDLDEQAAAEDAVAKVLSRPGSDPEAALVSTEPRSGEVRALVGGHDFFGDGPSAKFDLATQKGRPAGSSFKPLVLTAALADGVPLSRTYPAPSRLRLPQPGGQPVWDVENYEGMGGGSLDLVDATVESVNTVYAQLITDVGPDRAVAIARRMGIESPLLAVPSAVLGTNDVTPLDMATAYATLANRGLRVDPVFVTRVTTADGTVLYEHRRAATRVVRRDVADAVTGVLQQVVEHGTGVEARIGRPVAGKTGTTQAFRDAWFVGYTPDRVASVWVGFPDAQRSMVPPATREKVTGGTWPARIWQLFMSSALASTPVTAFAAEATVDNGKAVVPDVLGLRLEEATQRLRVLGFDVETLPAPDRERPPDLVAGQQPPASTSATRGSTVTLTITARAVAVPDVLGMTADAARAALARAGLDAKVAVEDEPPSAGAASRRGVVWRQQPLAGTDVVDGADVRVSVNPAG